MLRMNKVVKRTFVINFEKHSINAGISKFGKNYDFSDSVLKYSKNMANFENFKDKFDIISKIEQDLDIEIPSKDLVAIKSPKILIKYLQNRLEYEFSLIEKASNRLKSIPPNLKFKD
ncbi:hypothetical protein MHBO_003396 [Bonamia ostreae]|uniref:Uncharacterized protein n=1 Tax=Bonamia ostreae TaxID=126728 RepID=A0ABV2AQA3_9EUKA